MNHAVFTVADAYEKFSPNGIVAQKSPPYAMQNALPSVRMRWDIGDTPQEAGKQIGVWITNFQLAFIASRWISKDYTRTIRLLFAAA